MTYVDYIFLLILFIVQPIHGAWSFRRYVARVNQGEPSNRIKLYNQTLALEWIGIAALGVAWWYFSRPLSALGFVSQIDSSFWWSLLAVTLMCAYLIFAIWQAKQLSEEDKQDQREKFGKMGHFLPQNSAEYNRITWLSITAGICEEIVYRGYVFWCLAHFVPTWAVVILSSIIFGLGHTYQGIAGVFKVKVVGLLLGSLYVVSGSIWLPILAHALFDILQGRLILEFYNPGKEVTNKNAEKV